MSDEIGLLHQLVDKHFDRQVETLRNLLRIPSLKERPSSANAPYGPSIRKALDYTLTVCCDLGFTVKDVDGHAAHAEFGAGETMVAALGHLDVVPEGDGWTYPPYGAEINNERIYARGALDDKGGIWAALFAAYALQQSELPLLRRVRVIFGCDEESGFGCVHHYWNVAGEERPLYAFTPDANFPMIYAEKGIMNIELRYPQPDLPNDLKLTAFTAGLRPNMVPAHAELKLTGPVDELAMLEAALQTTEETGVTTSREDSTLTVLAVGRSAHGSTPEVGDNAVLHLVRALMSTACLCNVSWLQWLEKSCDTQGVGLQIEGSDEVSGPLTNNLGLVSIEDGAIQVTYNIRYPVTWNPDRVSGGATRASESAGWRVDSIRDSAALYVPLDAEPARTLLDVYRLETRDFETQPRTMGGGTYARATPNAIAYGPHFLGRFDGPPHEPDESISLQTLREATYIYAHALYRLAADAGI